MNDIIYAGRHSITYFVPIHMHESLELIYCTSGGGEIAFHDSVMRYGTDSVVIIPPMLPHSNRSEDGFTNVHVNIVDPTIQFTAPVVLSCGQGDYMRQAFEAAFYYYSHGGNGSMMLLPVYGQLIVSTARLLMMDSFHSEIVEVVIRDILKNYPDPDYDLKGFLYSLPFSLEYLNKLFKKEVGKTPRQYMTDKRLENAASNIALSACGSSISQIARQSGFHEPLYFSRLFKQKYGVSPKYYKSERIRQLAEGSDSTRINLQAHEEEEEAKDGTLIAEEY